MSPRPFGTLPSGESVELYTLSNDAGSTLKVLTYGGIVTSLCVPDREGRLADVVLGFDNLGEYLAGHPYFGAIAGRIAGRVTGGRLSVGGRDYALARNDGPNHLHGGLRGLDKRVWTAREVVGPDRAASLRLTYLSPDGEEGYPGAIEISVTYTLTAANAFMIETEASSDRVTPLSLAQHSYFNLAGESSGDISGHEVQILAEDFVATDGAMTLSDRRESVAGRASDFRIARELSGALAGLHKAHGDLYLLRPPGAPQPSSPTHAARVAERRSGRVLDVLTDEPCLQFYTGVSLDGTLVGKGGRPYGRHAGFCMECQGYPNGASLDAFGDILVRPERPMRRRTVYAFSAN